MQDTFTDAWYLLRCRQNYWKTIQQNLNEAGLKTCCPLILERRSLQQKCHRLALLSRPQNFCFSTSCSISLSRLSSATSFFSR